MADWWDSYEQAGQPVAASEQREAWERFKDSYMSAALHSPFGGEGAARLYFKHVKGYTDDQINEVEKQLSDNYAKKQEADPAFNGGSLQQGAVREGIDLLGGLLGGVDPSYVIAPGKSAVQRVAAQAGVNAGMDAVSQGVEIHRGVRDKFDPYEVGMNAAAGAVFQGGGEVIHAHKTGRMIREGMNHPDWAAVNDIIVNDLEGGGTLSHPKTSKKGALGPQQVMPETARDPGFGIRRWDGKTQTDLARVGRQYSAAMMSKYDGDATKVLAAYNAGPGRVDHAIAKHGENWFDYLPNETKDYVSKGVMKLGGAANDVNGLQRGFPRPGNITEQPVYPDDLGEINIIRQEQASIEDQANANDHLASGLNVEDFPEERIVNRENTGPSSDIPFRMTEDSGIPNIDDARSRRYQRDMEENNRSLKESDDKYVSDLSERVDNLHTILDNHLDGQPTLSTGELKELRQGWEDLNSRMERSKLPALGHGVVKEALRKFKWFEEQLKRNEGSTERHIVDNTGYEKHTPYVGNPKTPANDLELPHLEDSIHYENDLSLPKNLPSPRNLRPAIRTTDGKIHAGQKGELHMHVVRNLMNKDVPENKWGASGFVDEKGHFLTKSETDAKYGVSDATLMNQKKSFVENFKNMLKDDSGAYKEPYDKLDTSKSYADLDPEGKLIKAVREARPISAEQRSKYRAARSERSGHIDKIQQEGKGLEGYHQQLKALQGELPKAKYESIAEHFTEEDINHLLNKINSSKTLLPLERVKAQTALVKLLGGDGAKAPTAGDIKLLAQVYSEDFITALLDNRPFMAKFWHGVGSALNMPRALMASYDLSAPLRQGVFFIGKKEFWKSFGHMFKLFGSEAASKALMENIRSRPTWAMMKKAGLAISDPHSHFLADREEAFMGADFAEHIPIAGLGVKASNRAYSGFLNKLRADVFDDYVRQYENLGINLATDPKKLKEVASFINAATGRGNLGKWGNPAAPALSTVFFSPRLIASRVQMLYPGTYIRSDPVLRKEAIKSLLSFGAVAVTTAGLAKYGLGLGVETDPTSADFMKIKFRNTRFDILGGWQQYIRLGAELVTGKATASNGSEHDLTSGKFGQDTRRDVLENFVINKFSPVASFFSDMLEGKNTVGQKFDVSRHNLDLGNDSIMKNDIMERFVPLVIQDMVDGIKEYGAVGAAVALPSVFGIGVQTYEPKQSKSKSTNWWSDYEAKDQKASSTNWWKDYEK